jgi:hypothetical protein
MLSRSSFRVALILMSVPFLSLTPSPTHATTPAPLPSLLPAQGATPRPTPAPAPGPVKVNACKAIQNVATAPTFGYVPSQNIAGQHGWTDPYGNRLSQNPSPGSQHGARPSLNIDWINTAPQPLKEVEFGLVAGGSLVAEVRDTGHFTQGAEIKREFGLSRSVFPLGTAHPRCVPLRATFQNGTVWTNPHLPPVPMSIYKNGA